MQEASIRERQVKQEESYWVGVEHIRRLDIEPEDRSTCQQKTSGREFGHRAKNNGNCTKEIGVAKVNSPIGQ